jgi:hypothetical protein
MQYAYDGQIKRYLTQFMRLMSNFAYKNASGEIIRVPVRYGDATRQVSSILNKNTENVMPSAPFIACYIKDLKFDRSRMQDPTYVSKLSIREREFGYVDEDPSSPTYGQTINEYANVQGGNYTIERLMPTPYVLTFNADIWTTNLDQKLQLWEQITVLFNPAIELQTTDNYIDWTSLSYLELLDSSVFESRTVPQGVANDLSIATLQFTAPAWISPPAKVKKLGIITKIITNVFAEPTGTGADGGYEDVYGAGDIFGNAKPDMRVVVTSGDFGLLVLNNTAVLVPSGYADVSEGWTSVDDVPGRPSWLNLIDQYPGKFKAGYSQIRLTKPDGREIVATISINPVNESLMALAIDADTMLDTLPSITRIINPQTFNPGIPATNTRYLILEDVIEGTEAWPNFTAAANDIVEWNGSAWIVAFNSTTSTSVEYITNAYTGVQYKWDGSQWSKSYEGYYTNEEWRLVL